MDCYCAAKSSPGLPAWRRSIKKWPRHDLLCSSRARNALKRSTLDFEGHLVKANRPQNVEHADDIEVNRVRIAANEPLGFRIFVVNLFQFGGERVVSHFGLVEIRIAVRID